MKYIQSFSEDSLCNLILDSKKSLHICLPLLQPNVIDAIHQLNYNLSGEVSINIGIDFSPETFRQGYGEIKPYEEIWKSDYNIINIKDNRISFVISDDFGFFLFFESRYLIPADKETINAVAIDPTTIVRLKHYFFSAFKEDELTDQLANAIVDESIKLKSIESEIKEAGTISSNHLDYKLVEKVENDLKANPPLKPDYKRIVDYYSNKFQYAKLEFSGANLETKKIELPKKALPIRDAELKKRLETKLNLFDSNDSEDHFKPLEDFKKKIQQVRDDYLTPLKARDESIIDKKKKEEFLNAIKLLEEDLKKLGVNSINSVSILIENTKKTLINDLVDFFIANPESISKDDIFLNADPVYKKQEAQNLASEVVAKIRWPKAHELFGAMSIKWFFSDITFEDLKNEELIQELESRGIISDADVNKLASFGKGIAIDNK